MIVGVGLCVMCNFSLCTNDDDATIASLNRINIEQIARKLKHIHFGNKWNVMCAHTRLNEHVIIELSGHNDICKCKTLDMYVHFVHLFPLSRLHIIVEMTTQRQGIASLKCDDLLITLYGIV